MILFWIFAVVILLLSFIFPKSKLVAIIQLFMIWLLMGWNAGGGDFGGNESIYYASRRFTFTGIRYGWLSNLIGYIFQKIIHYNVATTFVVLLIFGIIILKESPRPCLIVDLFLIYPFIDSIIQKRFFMGMMFIFFGMLFLMKKNRFLYIGCVVLAIGFHFSFIIFLPMVFIDLLDEKKEKYFISFALLMEIIIIYGGGEFLQRFISNGKLNRYIFETSYSSEIIGVIYALSLLGYIFICERVTSEFPQNERVLFFRKLNRLSIILAPMNLFESVYMRYYRIVLLWAFIIICSETECPLMKKGIVMINKKNVWIWIFILYFGILNFGIYISSAQGLKGHIHTMLTNALFS